MNGRTSTRKTRKDKGTRKPHPKSCLHCKMVRAFWEVRAIEIEEQGGWRNESPVFRYTASLIEWQAHYYRHERAREQEAA
jgi:hypothetical protein